MKRVAIGVMCRDPSNGGGKTRLRHRHPAAFVTELQAAMLADTLAALDVVTADERVVFVAAPSSEFSRRLPAGWSSSVQEGEDLGARIAQVFRGLFARGAERVLVTGSDAPLLALSPREVRDLDDDEVLLVPSDDGGYAAIALARPDDALFAEMPWSTSAVADETRRRARSRGLRVRELPATFDVDEPEDVERLRDVLSVDPSRARCTARLLLSL